MLRENVTNLRNKFQTNVLGTVAALVVSKRRKIERKINNCKSDYSRIFLLSFQSESILCEMIQNAENMRTYASYGSGTLIFIRRHIGHRGLITLSYWSTENLYRFFCVPSWFILTQRGL